MEKMKSAILLCVIILNKTVGISSTNSKRNTSEDGKGHLSEDKLRREMDENVVKSVSLYKHPLSFFPSLFDVRSGGVTSQCHKLITSGSYMHYNDTDSRFYHKDDELDKTYDQNMSAICPIEIDYFHFYLVWSEILVNDTLSDLTMVGGDLYQCEIFPSELCNSYSICSTDECNCWTRGTLYQDQVMFCPRRDGGIACISFANICDGVVDCADHSDECLCQDSYELSCHKIPQIKRLCLPRVQYCLYLPQIRELDCSGHPTYVNCTDGGEYDDYVFNSELSNCLQNLNSHSGFFIHNLQSGVPAETVCRSQCTNTTELKKWEKFCQHIKFQHLGMVVLFQFRCEIENIEHMDSCALSDLCNGIMDCKNNADELGCPGRFYCSTNETVSWIDESKVCDQRKDCINGKDECTGCIMDGLASSEFLVQSKIITALASFVGLSTITINVFVALKTFHSSPNSKAAEIDTLLRLLICFYDLLMGIYLLLMMVAGIVLRFKGDYCQFDEEWRASLHCMMLGIIFSLSSHGSLLIIGIMGIVRCIKCTMGSSIELSKRKVMIVTMVVSLLNLVHAIVPILPVHQIQNVFRTSMNLVSVQRNPFISTEKGLDMIEHIRKIHSHYFENSSSADIPKILADLKHANITSDDTIFDVIDIGYYGNTPLCIFNIFKMQNSYQLYKVFYCIAVSILLIAISGAYIIITIKAKRSRRQVGPDNNDNTTQLALKVSLMIISQLVSWVSFMAAVIHFSWVSNSPPPAKTFEIFALVVIPINSLLNPIFYSGLYKRMTSLLWRVWEKLTYSVDNVATNEIELNCMANILNVNEQLAYQQEDRLT